MVDAHGHPPGWYGDPAGRHRYRYWDGTTWTAEVSDGGPTVPTAPTPTASGGFAPVPPPLPGAGFAVPPPAPRAAVSSGRTRLVIASAAAAVLALIAGVVYVVRAPGGPAPTRLASVDVTSTSVTLKWATPPESTRLPDHYVVSRDGAEVGTDVRQQEFRDEGLEPLRVYTYEVRAVTGGRTSRPTAGFKVMTRPDSAVGLTLEQISVGSVNLRWNAPRGGNPDEYVVQRDDEVLITLPGTELSYADELAPPGATVTYAVIAVVRGQRAEPVTLEVTTANPSVAEARLEGGWEVVADVTRNHGTKLKVGDSTSGSWTFTPDCASGACDVRLTGQFASTPFSVPLTRKGAVYTGNAKAPVATCRGKAMTNTLAITITVTAGQTEAGVWTASSWKGSLTMYYPYTASGSYYCPKQDAVFSLTPDGARTT